MNREEKFMFERISQFTLLSEEEITIMLYTVFEEMDYLINTNSALHYIAIQLGLDIDIILNTELKITAFSDIKLYEESLNIQGIVVKLKSRFQMDTFNLFQDIIIQDAGIYILVRFKNDDIKLLDKINAGSIIRIYNTGKFTNTIFDGCTFKLKFNDKNKLEIMDH